MVHHVSTSTELLATVLGAIIGSLIVVNAHMNLQIVAIVELFLAPGHCALEFCLWLMEYHVGLEICARAKFFPTPLNCAFVYVLVDEHGNWLTTRSSKALLTRHRHVGGLGQAVLSFSCTGLSDLRPQSGCSWASDQADSLGSWLLDLATHLVNEEYCLRIEFIWVSQCSHMALEMLSINLRVYIGLFLTYHALIIQFWV